MELQQTFPRFRQSVRAHAECGAIPLHHAEFRGSIRERPVIRTRWLSATALCLLVAGCTSDARMAALKTDMAARQASAETVAKRPDASADDKERARAYASAQSCIDQIQAHGKAVQASHMATAGALAAVSLAGPGGAVAARALAPVGAAATLSQAPYSVACY
jgi:hypothetical protein